MKKPLCSPFGGSKAAGKSQSSKLKGLLSNPTYLSNLTYSPSLPSLTLPSPPLMEGRSPQGRCGKPRSVPAADPGNRTPRMTECGSAPWQPRPIALSPRMSTSKKRLREYQGIRILSTEAFLAILTGETGS